MAEYEKVELPYRRISFYAYLFVLVFIGIPIWWYTTTPYRAVLDNFDAELNIHIPITIRFYHEQQSDEGLLKAITNRWSNEEVILIFLLLTFSATFAITLV